MRYAQVYKKRRASKQHKVCSLKGCLRHGKIGCMHCTCDISCKFAHDGGQCGNFREGSQNHCRKEFCPHDSTCTHSKRALCYQCRRCRITSFKRQEKESARVLFHPPRLPGLELLGSIKYNEDELSLKSIWRTIDRQSPMCVSGLNLK